MIIKNDYLKRIVFKGSSISNKEILLTPMNYFSSNYQGELYILSNNGEILNYKKTNCLNMDFKQISKNRYVYFSSDDAFLKQKFEHFSNGHYEFGSLNILDENFNNIHSGIRIKKFGSIPYDNYPIHIHDSLILNDNHYFLMACVLQNHGYYNKVINCIIQEQKNDEVVWQFESIDYDLLFNFSLIKNNFWGLNSNYNDYSHMNSFCITDNGENMLISYRNIGIIKINIKTKKILWIMSFKKINTKYDNIKVYNSNFCFQHDIRMLNKNSFSIFNNNCTWFVDKLRFSNAIQKNPQVIEINDNNNEFKYNIFNTTSDKVPALGGAVNVANGVYDVCFGTQGIIEEIDFYNKNYKNFELYFEDKCPIYRIERGL